MKKIGYEITFHTDWHCGSGLAAGADVDALVIKDKDGLPFVPGKTIKGLLREAVEYLSFDDELVTQAFGKTNEKETGVMSSLFYSNAVLREGERTEILANQLVSYLYRSISSTSIDDEGIAKEHSLRRVQVTVPCILQGEILIMTDEINEKEIEKLFEKAFAYVKCIGVGRNRGLGRCTIRKIEEGGSK